MRRQGGDTIIEVILAVTIFSMVGVSAISLMNRGMAMAQRSLEITLVRQQIDAQAEMLRFTNDQAAAGNAQYAQMWDDVSPVDSVQSILNADVCPAAASLPGWFAFRPSDLASGGFSLINASTEYTANPAAYTYAKVDPSGSQGISIQLARVQGGDAYDAHIQACWYGPGYSKPVTIGTIVRLYEPGA